MFALIFATQVLGGTLLVLGVRLFALVILAPVIVNWWRSTSLSCRHDCRLRSWWLR